ncbi:MAG: large conductance mechanosensitive channel protein MscL [Angelakisella sp.]|nr:large conductance mechanosensitive channel protein MscL [Angelakisella sp.]
MEDKKKGFLSEFKEFISRGNVMDMAIGVIVGGAFKGIIDSLVNDIIMPVISVVVGGLDFSNWFIALDGGSYATLEAAKTAGAATLNYGSFLTVIINFLLMAFVIFSMVKAMNTLATRYKKAEEKPAPKTKKCPFCKTDIALDATRCPHCTSNL